MKGRRALKIFKFIDEYPRKFISYISIARVEKFIYYVKKYGIFNAFKEVKKYFFEGNKILHLDILFLKKRMKINECKKLIFPINREPQISILISCQNQKYNYLSVYACLYAILKHTKDISYEVIIFGDRQENIAKLFKEVIKNISITHYNQDMVFFKACNTVVESAKGRYIVFLNETIQVQENWLISLIDIFQKDKMAKVIGAKVIYPNGLLQDAGRIVWNGASIMSYGDRLDSNFPEFNYIKEIDCTSFDCFAIEKKAWESVGRFDENYYDIDYGVADFAFKIKNQNYKILYQPNVLAVKLGEYKNKSLSPQIEGNFMNSFKYFKEKWDRRLKLEHYREGEEGFRAREYGRNKKYILLIDHHVPEFDKDAGSKTIYHYIKLWADMGYIVKVMGDDFLARQPYTGLFEKMGIEVFHGIRYASNYKRWFQNNGKYFDYIFLNRPDIAEKYIDIVQKNCRGKVIYNVCDLHFLRLERQYEKTRKKNLLKNINKCKKQEFDVMNKADIILTLSSFEKKIIEKNIIEKKIFLAPIYIYENICEELNNNAVTSDIMFVGGFRHEPNVDGIIWFVKNVFPLILSRKPEIKLYIAGSDPTEEILSMANSNIVVTGYIPDNDLHELYLSKRICIIPLRYGAGVKGKTVEAMYNKIPIVSTAMGLEGLDGLAKCFISCDTPDEFANRILLLYDNQSLREQLIREGIRYVNQNFSIARAETLFKRIFS